MNRLIPGKNIKTIGTAFRTLRGVSTVKTFVNFSGKDLNKIGYPNTESNWITNMRDAYLEGYCSNPEKYQKFSDCKHSGGSFMYTKIITNNIHTNEFEEWKENFLHLNYDDILKMFYLTGFQNAGNGFISHNFKKSGNKDALEIFRKEFTDKLSEGQKIAALKKLARSTNFNA
jgi:hypothetical protein